MVQGLPSYRMKKIYVVRFSSDDVGCAGRAVRKSVLPLVCLAYLSYFCSGSPSARRGLFYPPLWAGNVQIIKLLLSRIGDGIP